MVKILVCGSVNGEWKLLCDKINALHKSAHGPFDLLFCSGTFFRDESDLTSLSNHYLPLPVYIYENHEISAMSLPENIHFLPRCGTVMINDLVVGTSIANGDLNAQKNLTN